MEKRATGWRRQHDVRVDMDDKEDDEEDKDDKLLEEVPSWSMMNEGKYLNLDNISSDYCKYICLCFLLLYIV